MAEPIKEYTSDKQLQSSLDEWQTRLFLDDWIIYASIVDPDEMDDLDNNGQVNMNFVDHSANIKLAKISQDERERSVSVPCQEAILVHELLHLKYNLLILENTYEERVLDLNQHMLLEQLAKSLIMAKYHIGFDWFRN